MYLRKLADKIPDLGRKFEYLLNTGNLVSKNTGDLTQTSGFTVRTGKGHVSVSVCVCACALVCVLGARVRALMGLTTCNNKWTSYRLHIENRQELNLCACVCLGMYARFNHAGTGALAGAHFELAMKSCAR